MVRKIIIKSQFLKISNLYQYLHFVVFCFENVYSTMELNETRFLCSHSLKRPLSTRRFGKKSLREFKVTFLKSENR